MLNQDRFLINYGSNIAYPIFSISTLKFYRSDVVSQFDVFKFNNDESLVSRVSKIRSAKKIKLTKVGGSQLRAGSKIKTLIVF